MPFLGTYNHWSGWQSQRKGFPRYKIKGFWIQWHGTDAEKKHTFGMTLMWY